MHTKRIHGGECTWTLTHGHRLRGTGEGRACACVFQRGEQANVREQEVAFAVVHNLRKGSLVALQEDGFLVGREGTGACAVVRRQEGGV